MADAYEPYIHATTGRRRWISVRRDADSGMSTPLEPAPPGFMPQNICGQWRGVHSYRGTSSAVETNSMRNSIKLQRRVAPL